MTLAPAPADGTSNAWRWPLAATLAAAAMQWPFVMADAGWFDEIFSVVVAMQPLGELWRATVADQTNPPGYYLALKLWMLVGDEGLAWARVLSAAAAAATVGVVCATARTLGLRISGVLVATVATATSPLLWAMGSEARAYALLACVASVGLLVSARAQRFGATNARVATLAALGVLLFSIHVYGAFVVAGLAIATGAAATRGAADKREARFRAWRVELLVGGPALVVAVAWIALVTSGAPAESFENANWIPGTSPARQLLQLSGAVVGVLETNAGRFAVPLVLAGAFVWVRALQRRDGGGFASVPAWASLAAGMPVVLVLLADLVSSRNLWLVRYATALIPALALMIGVAVDGIPVRFQRVASVALCAWCAFAGLLTRLERRAKPDWPAIVATLARDASTQLCVTERYVDLPLRYYVFEARRTDIAVAPIARCARTDGTTWVVVRAPTAGTPPTPVIALDPELIARRLTLARGWQDLDAYLVRWPAP